MWNDWQIIYQQSWTREFTAMVRKRLPHSSESADDTMNEVRQELAIKLYELSTEPSSVSSYLRTAFRNTLEDYLRKKEGYPRPPEWIKKLGASYERIYKLLCLENRAVNDVQAIMQSLYHYTRDFIQQIIVEVRAGVINCGAWRDKISLDIAMAEVEQINRVTEPAASPDVILQGMDCGAVVSAILGQAEHPVGHSAKFTKFLSALAECKLDDNERLLLRLIYTDEFSVSEAARKIQLKDSEARKLLKQLFIRLRAALTKSGFSEL